MSLLQDVLRSQSVDSKIIERKLNSLAFSQSDSRNQANGDDSDDELVPVVSMPGTPSRTRPPSPTRSGASARPLPGPLHISSCKRDPLKAFPTEVSQRIFSRLKIPDLAKCALVSKKWNRSQTINYVWFQLYRKDNFHDDSLPAGKWTKRESKQNWRILYIQTTSRENRSPTSTSFSFSRGSGYTSPSSASGYQTPRELKEEKWRQEAEAASKPGKIEMRGMYKELGGRKSRSKVKLGSVGGVRDKGGWGDSEDW